MGAQNIRFASEEHRDFFLSMISKSRHNDSYHRSFFYVMGIAPETRANIQQMFNFKEDCIEPDGMHGGWQTSGTVRVCRLAFNLWNGYTEPKQSNAFSPEDLFCCEFAPYFMEGIKSVTLNTAVNCRLSKSRQNRHDKDLIGGI